MKAFGSTRVPRAAAIAVALLGASIAPSQAWALEPMGDGEGLRDLSARIITAEGGPAPNPLSSAAGYGQFLSGTWLEMFERAYPQVAQTMSREQILALRDIRPLAEDLTNRYAKANAAALRRLGLPATAGELSLAHAIGPRGAVSVLTAAPARPAGELLQPEAIAANPVLRGMTVGALRQWAAIRVGARAEPSGDNSPSAAQPAFRLVGPDAGFRVDRRDNTSGAPGAERNAAAVLPDLVDAISKAGRGKSVQLRPSTAAWLMSVGIEASELLRGDPGAIKAFDGAGSRAVLDAIREVSDQPSFREFKAIGVHAGSRGELPRAVIRAVAIALMDKMNSESAITTNIAHHGRGVRAPPGTGRSGGLPLRDAADASGTTAAPPL